MRIADPARPTARSPVELDGAAPARRVPPSPRPVSRVVLHWVRRGHLYLGLFLFPWAVLYGVTAFLFNHPTAFSDQPTTRFGREALRDTPMEDPPAAAAVAADVVAALQARANGAAYRLVDPGAARYTRDFAFATVRTDAGEQVSVLVEVNGSGGTVRAQPAAEKRRPEPAPFAVGGRPAGGGRGKMQAGRGANRPRPAGDDWLTISDPLHERVKAAIPIVLERGDLPTGDVTVTSVPDLTFAMADGDGAVWAVTYNAMAGTVAGTRDEDKEPREVTVRRFLTRLHLAHGYPSSLGARWAWAVIVDAMAAVMVFWGVSGLFMWWQIKATRWWGVLTLAGSAVVAGLLAVGMYRVFVS